MEFLIIASTHFMALLSPGPDFFLILQTALKLPKRYAVSLCCGIAVANGCYILLAIGGLETFRNAELVSLSLKYLGGAYLFYLGVCLMFSPTKDGTVSDREGKLLFIHHKSLVRQFCIGLISALLNPKNGVFYLSLFTAIVSSETPFIIRAGYGLWMCATVLLWDVMLAMFLGNSTIRRNVNNLIFSVQKITGIVLAGFGIMLTLT